MIDTIFPKNTIIIIQGATCPDGWTLCNGASGTPDMRGRSPIGINGGVAGGVDIALDASSDESQHAHAENHTHTFSTVINHDGTSGTAEVGSTTHIYTHSHNVVATTNTTIATGGDSLNYLPYYAVNFCKKVVD